jgi:membrane-bound lytic murein transglycosylase A
VTQRPVWAAMLALILSACATAAPLPIHLPPPARPPAPAPTPIPVPPPSPLAPQTLPLSALPGWSQEDHAQALDAIRQTCGVARESRFAQACARLRALDPMDAKASRAWLEANFRAEPVAGEGVLTAYFAPEYSARRTPTAEYIAPVRPPPPDLKPVDAGMFDPALQGRPGAARDVAGILVPYPDRAEIEASPSGEPLAWMRPEELFFLQIQGSGRLTFDDGQRVKVSYAANNGRPFLAIAAPMVEHGLLPRDQAGGEQIRAWLADHRGPEADAVMRLNPRYVFFNLAPDDGLEPAGAAGVPLPPGRAVAVDTGHHAMGDLLWLDADTPLLANAAPAYRRLVTALDVGGAIRGEVRADLYLGTGVIAGLEAGRVRHGLRLYRLTPVP